MNTNLMTLYTACADHLDDYGHGGCGWGTTIEQMVDDLMDSGHSWNIVCKVMNLAFYRS